MYLEFNLKIDVLRRQEELLINSSFKSGRYKVGRNSVYISSGIYFYKITEVSDNKCFGDIKQMILAKVKIRFLIKYENNIRTAFVGEFKRFLKVVKSYGGHSSSQFAS